MHVRFVPSIILLNKAALVEQYYLVIHADASSGNEGILESASTLSSDIETLNRPVFVGGWLV
jgi:hypothetical protein